MSMMVPSFTRCRHTPLFSLPSPRARTVSSERRNILGRANVFYCHGQEFLPGIAVLLHRGRVYRKKAQRLPVKDPGGMWIVVKQFAVSFFALAEQRFGALARGNVAGHGVDGFLLGHGNSVPQQPLVRAVFAQITVFKCKSGFSLLAARPFPQRSPADRRDV